MIVRIRTSRDLLGLLAIGQTAAWVVSKQSLKSHATTRVHVVNWTGTQRIEADYSEEHTIENHPDHPQGPHRHRPGQPPHRPLPGQLPAPHRPHLPPAGLRATNRRPAHLPSPSNRLATTHPKRSPRPLRGRSRGTRGGRGGMNAGSSRSTGQREGASAMQVSPRAGGSH
ncbi:hypothetical protein [Pirellulimonas nuda]|uniref:hypothetical protein n=1 Tax=Pirellulimonas nuda TaxID=2528009 RepID=UPI0018D390D6|nr:hypothetical protein [Pirellulimonas nuda]